MSPADLARALVAHPRWEWREGMRWRDHSGRAERSTHACSALGDTPDLSDDATAGAMLAMVAEEVAQRSLVADERVVVEYHDEGVAVIWRLTEDAAHAAHGTTLGEACAEALLRLWGSP